MKTLATSSLLILLLALSATQAAPSPAPAAQPAPNWYDVEVIVFRSTDPSDGSLETWPADPGQPDWNGAVPLNPADSVGPAVPYQLLSPVNEQLGEDWTRLKRSKGYEPLLHLTWTQPALDRASAAAVRIGVPPSAVPAPSTHMPAVATPNTPLQATLAYGDAKLSTTGPYLHFDLDLVLQGPPAKRAAPTAGTINATLVTPPAGSAAPAAPSFQLYRLLQDRRIDGGKLVYFDHPLFGAIVLVTPVRHSAGTATAP